MASQTITESTFRDTIDKDGIVLLDFWAGWCGPCKRFGPIFEAASEQHPDVVFGKIDTEAEQKLAAALKISSIPTVMAFRDGILLHSQPGALGPADLERLITAIKDIDMDDVRRQLAEQPEPQGDPRV